MEYIDKIIAFFIKLIRNICSGLLALMLVITTMHVFFRYVLNNPLIWSEEISLVLLIWFGFFAISNELYNGNHMALVMFYEKFPPKLKKIVDLIKYFIIAAFCMLMTVHLYIIIVSISGAKLPVSGIPKIVLYIPVIISSILMFFYSIILFIKALKYNYLTKGDEN